MVEEELMYNYSYGSEDGDAYLKVWKLSKRDFYKITLYQILNAGNGDDIIPLDSTMISKTITEVTNTNSHVSREYCIELVVRRVLNPRPERLFQLV